MVFSFELDSKNRLALLAFFVLAADGQVFFDVVIVAFQFGKVRRLYSFDTPMISGLCSYRENRLT